MHKFKKDNIQLKGFELSFKEIDEYLYTKKIRARKLVPKTLEFRHWDFRLLSRFKPFYSPLCDRCCMCAYGTCELSYNKKGACGINLEKQQSRFSLLTSTIGAATHASHARELVDEFLEKDPLKKLKYNSSIDIISPITTTITGRTPETPQDLDKVLNDLERELTTMMASTHMGQEGSVTDFESKALHSGMLDTLACEIAELAQINHYNYPAGDPETPIVEIGLGVIDKEKPIILCIGHNVAPGTEIIDYAEKIGVYEDIEVCGLCCTALDLTRYSKHSKIVGPISRQLMFLKLAEPDVVVIDAECIRSDIYELCSNKNIPLLSASEKAIMGLSDMTNEKPTKIINKIILGKTSGAFIRDYKKLGKVAVDLALKLKNLKRAKALVSKNTTTKDDTPAKPIQKLLEECNLCGECERSCPAMLPLTEAFSKAKKGDNSLLSEFYGKCKGCGKCLEKCRNNIPIMDILIKGFGSHLKSEKFHIRSGRGPIQDVEIRKVGAPIVFGDIPGVIVFAGCPNYANEEKDVQIMAEEFLKRGYIVAASGCSAMNIALHKDEEGKTLYERYPGDFDRGCLVNLGPCVANSHAIGSTIKIANIFGKVPLEKNFIEIADYILTRIGACIIAWGAFTQKAFAIVTGANRWGIPAIIGPHSSKYRRLYLGNNPEEMTEAAPPHLTYAAESLNECIVMTPKMCIRPNDTPRGRMIKLNNYIDLHIKYYGTLPEDLHFYVRDEKEIPYRYKESIMEKLKYKGWKPKE